MQSNCILAIDQGTTGTKVNLFDNRSRIIGSAYAEFTQSYPQPGRVEHDPVEIWESTLVLIRQALVNGNRESHSVAALGITNQRETTVLWSRETGKPVAPAVVWQDRRTSGIC